MKIEVDGKEIQIRPINYSQKLELKGHFVDVYAKGTDNVSVREYNKLLGHTSEIAFANPEESLKVYDNEFQMKILTASLMEYIGESEKAKKDNGG